MDRDTKCEVIKAVAAGMSDEDIANFADMELDELEAFKQENSQPEERNGGNSDHEYCNDNE